MGGNQRLQVLIFGDYRQVGKTEVANGQTVLYADPTEIHSTTESSFVYFKYQD